MSNNVEQNRINHEIEVDANLEQRRSNRLGAIIGILALVGTILVIVFKMMIKAINMWPSNGYTYQYMQLLMVILVSSVIILIFRLISYCYYDLKRHNLKDKNYMSYDLKSDEKYLQIIEDLKIYFSFLILTLYVLIPIRSFGENSKKGNILGTLMILILIIVVIITVFLARKSIFGWIKPILIRVFFFTIVGFLVYYIGFSSVISKESIISVGYNIDGIIDINYEAGNYSGFQIYIYKSENNQLVWMKEIEEEDVLKAKEITYINDKVSDIEGNSEGFLLNSEVLYSSCKIDLEDSDNILLNEAYYVLIISEQERKSVQLINSFKKDGNYTFAKSKMVKKF